MQKINELKEVSNKHGVYAIKCVGNGKFYIGSVHSTENGNSIRKRLRDHIYRLKRNKHANSMMQRAWNKYGEENFEFYLVEVIDGNEIILEREQYWMDFYESYNTDKGFNLCPTAGSTYNFKWSEESKLNNSGEKHPMYGRKHTEESKKKMSESLTGLMVGEKHPNFGKPMPEDLKERLRELSRERKGELNPFYGKEHTGETKQKISETKKANYIKEEHPFYGKQHTEESKKLMSEAKLGIPQTPEAVEIRSKSLRKVKRSKTKYKGVCYDKAQRKYSCRLSIPGKGYIAIGRFKDEEEAAHNYDFYAKKIHGDNCFLNFPEYDYTNFVPKRIIEI